MKNLHRIRTTNIPEWVKLFATRWHIADPSEPKRRVGLVGWDGHDVWDMGGPNVVYGKFTKDQIESYSYVNRTWVPASLFNPDMVIVIKTPIYHDDLGQWT